MRAYLITGNPGSGKSTLAAELSRRGLTAVDTDDLAFWEDEAGVQVNQPPDAGDGWRLAHRWVWGRVLLEQRIDALSRAAGRIFFCGIARNQIEMLDLFEQVFLLVIDDDTQMARLKTPERATSPDRTEAIKQQIRAGRPAFQAQMLASEAIPLDATASPKILADSLLSHLDPGYLPEA